MYFQMALMAAGKNVTNFDKKTLKLVSPRFMSLVADQEDDDLVSRSPLQGQHASKNLYRVKVVTSGNLAIIWYILISKALSRSAG